MGSIYEGMKALHYNQCYAAVGWSGKCGDTKNWQTKNFSLNPADSGEMWAGSSAADVQWSPAAQTRSETQKIVIRQVLLQRKWRALWRRTNLGLNRRERRLNGASPVWWGRVLMLASTGGPLLYCRIVNCGTDCGARRGAPVVTSVDTIQHIYDMNQILKRSSTMSTMVI